jgi:hypothetical protein
MTVGTEHRPDLLVQNLMALEQDMLAVCEKLHDRLSSQHHRDEVEVTCRHLRAHLEELRAYAEKIGLIPPQGGDGREYLMAGRIKLAGLTGGDSALLGAMARNESTLVDAWQNALGNPDTPADLMPLVETALTDATRHRDWLRHATST